MRFLSHILISRFERGNSNEKKKIEDPDPGYRCRTNLRFSCGSDCICISRSKYENPIFVLAGAQAPGKKCATILAPIGLSCWTDQWGLFLAISSLIRVI